MTMASVRSGSVVIDNDCSPLVPAAIQDPGCPGQRDTNETAVLTGWATAANGLGRARVRAIVAIDTAWKHVCSSSSQDNFPGYCNEPANRNGNPTIIQADPNEYPGGPGAYDVLPTPTLGCSEIDPSLHANHACIPSGRKVVTGGGTLQNCNGGGHTYRGYFDCALTTPGQAYGGGPACVKNGDSRASTDPSNYKEVPMPGSSCPSGATGMVFSGDKPFGNVGSSETDGRNAYVMRAGNTGQVTVQGATFYGTVVVEGNGPGNCTGPNRDMMLQDNGTMITTTTNSTHRVNGTSGPPRTVYGYPLTLLIYDPQQLPPTAASPYAPQQTCADIGSGSGTEIHGLIYSGGHVEFKPVDVRGGIVAFDIQTQGSSSTYRYDDEYGKDAPPPGFSDDSGNTVVLVRKSFIVCADYAADTGGGTACR
jgi:hypothetical protein